MTAHPANIAKYFLGQQPFARAVLLYAVLGTTLLSGIYYTFEFAILNPDPESWTPLYRWIAVTCALIASSLWVMWACAGNLKSRTL
ncbi:MAG: hypothetical protein WBM68_03465, partial [Woeseia sp.]